MAADRDRLIRCRISNGVNHAEEFSASDGRTLREGAARAWERIEAAGRHQLRHGRRPISLRCVLQVRPRSAVDARMGWYPPCRLTPSGVAAYVEVEVSREILDRRPPDDWSEVWEWVCNSRHQDDALDRLAREFPCRPN